MDGSTPADTRKLWCKFFNRATSHRSVRPSSAPLPILGRRPVISQSKDYI